MDYGLQMYSVRDITGDDLEGALKKVSEIGYKGVEFAGFFGNTAEDVKSWLDKYGLKVTGTHTGWEEIRDHYEETLAYHKAIGNTTIIVPWADLSTAEKIDAFVAFANEYAPKLAAEGISLQYHNHDAEFLPNKDGQIPEDELIARTGLKFEVDTYWAFAGKRDPIQVITDLKDRISVIHLKDGDGGHGARSLGQGVAPVKAVWEKARELGFYMVVESEGLDPTGVEEVKRCFDYLASLHA